MSYQASLQFIRLSESSSKVSGPKIKKRVVVVWGFGYNDRERNFGYRCDIEVVASTREEAIEKAFSQQYCQGEPIPIDQLISIPLDPTATSYQYYVAFLPSGKGVGLAKLIKIQHRTAVQKQVLWDESTYHLGRKPAWVEKTWIPKS